MKQPAPIEKLAKQLAVAHVNEQRAATGRLAPITRLSPHWWANYKGEWRAQAKQHLALRKTK